MKDLLARFSKINPRKALLLLGVVTFFSFLANLGSAVFLANTYQQRASHKQNLEEQLALSTSQNASFSAEIAKLNAEDLRKTNNEVKASMSAISTSFASYAQLLEKVADARKQGLDTTKQEAELPKIVRNLSEAKWQDAEKQMTQLTQALGALYSDNTAKLAAALPAQQSQTPPTSGYSRQSVQTDMGTFVVSIIAADLASTRILTDVGSDGDCSNNCTVMPLADYVSRNGGFAGINGSYFCPPDYPSCQGKVNSFDTLAFNSRTKKYSNSDNNKYSTVPMFVQNADKSFRLMGRTLEWGRDTSIIGGLANYPILVSGGKAATGDTGRAGNKGFIGVGKGKVYIGHVHNASLAQAAKVLETLGLEQALNLDGGGSSALYYNGYKVGPGRALPNAVILAR